MLKSFVLHQRPFKIFDPANLEHRSIFYKFQQTQSWQHSPYQWTINDDSTNLVYFINRKLLDYYMGQEFTKKKASTTTRRKTATKPVLKLNELKTRKKAQN